VAELESKARRKMRQENDWQEMARVKGKRTVSDLRKKLEEGNGASHVMMDGRVVVVWPVSPISGALGFSPPSSIMTVLCNAPWYSWWTLTIKPAFNGHFNGSRFLVQTVLRIPRPPPQPKSWRST
jgi:hypothetical protein